MPGVRRRHTLSILLLALAAGSPAVVLEGKPLSPAPGGQLELSTQVGSGIDGLAQSYRRLYLDFAVDDRATAIARAAAFERATLVAEPEKGFDKLSAADARIFAELAELRPGTLLPLTLFYRQLARHHRAELNFGLAARANRATEHLLRQLAALATEESERRLVSAACQGFAIDSLDVFATSRAEEMLDLALRLAPDDVTANLALAVLLHKDGRYGAAALRLDRALVLDPANREARLRRALLAARAGHEERAASVLETLATDDSSAENDWIVVVATQERGRQLLSRKKWTEAISWFERAVVRFPAETAFRIALAFSQIRAGQREAASASVNDVPDWQREPGESARRRFTQAPLRLLEARRAEALAAAEKRWVDVRLALAQSNPSLDPVNAVPAALAVQVAP